MNDHESPTNSHSESTTWYTKTNTERLQRTGTDGGNNTARETRDRRQVRYLHTYMHAYIHALMH